MLIRSQRCGPTNCRYDHNGVDQPTVDTITTVWTNQVSIRSRRCGPTKCRYDHDGVDQPSVDTITTVWTNQVSVRSQRCGPTNCHMSRTRGSEVVKKLHPPIIPYSRGPGPQQLPHNGPIRFRKC
eukprot:6599716-Pyramimonas_sp.AAC.1